ncbi:MAG: GYD domain-containing protein, partial [Pseudomonadota bacterium]|nr:GYD domain-containing protein [Pseudomonadota bacterium]
MALYMMQIKYTREAIKDIAETGSNREDAVRPLIEKCGGKLINFYGLVGQEYNIVLIVEFNDLPNYLGMALSGILGGAIADWKTIQLFTAEEMVAATETYRA